jgi:hypothetical protein
MSVYLELFHGRKSVREQLQDWGSPGPILGPLAFVHTTYAADIKLQTSDGRDGVLYLIGDEQPELLECIWFGIAEPIAGSESRAV